MLEKMHVPTWGILIDKLKNIKGIHLLWENMTLVNVPFCAFKFYINLILASYARRPQTTLSNARQMDWIS